MLKWKSIGETFNDYFLVQRSQTGLEFAIVNQVEGAKSHTPVDREYSSQDEEATRLPSPNIYYRLKQVDLDGKFAYSAIISLANSGEPVQWNIYAFPNPVSEEFILYM